MLGCQVSVIQHGKELVDLSAGVRDPYSWRPVTPSTVFNVFSVTKAVTAAAVSKAGPTVEEPKMLSPETLRLNLDLDLAQTDMAHGNSGVLQEPVPGMSPPSVSDPSWEWLRVRDL